MTPTETMLLAVHRSPIIPLADICDKWFGLSIAEARRQAALRALPVPVWRTVESQKGPLMVRLTDLATFADATADFSRSPVAEVPGLGRLAPELADALTLDRQACEGRYLLDLGALSGHQSWAMLKRYTHIKLENVLEKLK